MISETFTEQELIKTLKEKSDFDDDTIITLVDDVLKDKNDCSERQLLTDKNLRKNRLSFCHSQKNKFARRTS